MGLTVGTDKDRNSSAEGAFQKYTVLLANVTALIPDKLSYETAVVLPLGLSTAACGLFEKDQLALNYPSLDPKTNNKTVLIWGGSTSVGSNAIQLAIAAGYEVITTASPKNFDYVKQLGAGQVFDYNSASVVNDIVIALKDMSFAGALAIGKGSTEPCLEITGVTNGTKFVSIASPPVSLVNGMTPKVMAKFISSSVSQQFKARTKGIKTKMIYGSSIKNNEISKMSFEDCCLAIYAKLNDSKPLWTFDKKLANQTSYAKLVKL